VTYYLLSSESMMYFKTSWT